MIKKIFTILLLNTVLLSISASPEFGFRSYIVKHKKKANVTEYELGNVASYTSMEIKMETGDIFYGAVWDNTYYGSEYEHYVPISSLTTIRSGSVKCALHAGDISREHGIVVTVPGTYTVSYDSDTQTFSWKAPEGTDDLLIIGDMNGDGILSVADITLLTSTILGQREVQFHQCEKKVEGIVLDANELSLKVGESASLLATVSPDNASNKNIIWSSSDSQIAEINEEGKVNALAPGSCTITATAADGSGVSASCRVTVASNVTTYDNPTITKGGTTTINIEASEGQTLRFDYSVTLSSSMYLLDSSWPSVSSDLLTISISDGSKSEEILKQSGPKVSTQGKTSSKFEGTGTYIFPATGNYVLTIKLTRSVGSGGADISNIVVM